MNPKKVRFLLLEDEHKSFEQNSRIIKNIFEEEEIIANQIYPNHSDILLLIQGFNNYLKKRSFTNGKKLPDELSDKINDIQPSSNDIIYFIDVNWTNKEGNRNGLDFFLDYLSNPNNKNDAIALTVYTIGEEFNGIQHVHKNSSDLKSELKNRITNTNVYNKCFESNMIYNKKSVENVLVVTATDKETSAVLNKVENELSIKAEASMIGEHAVSFLGVLNSCKIWHAQCEAGSGGPSGSQAIVTDLIIELKPKYILMPGIAFGLDETEQKIGDIIVSTHVYSYEKQRIGSSITIQRGEKVPSSPSLLSALRLVKQKWNKVNMHFGTIMSGEKLVDNPELVEQLKKIQPEAIGGEMEGAGLYSAAHRKKVDWIIFKSIVDWGKGKTDEHQVESSLFTSEVLYETLKIISK